MLTAHDGFTLQDIVSYAERYNQANGENGQDGHHENYSDNMGHEGPTADPAILAARALRKRNMMATLLLSQGTPMILGGDEIGRSQGGNNNAYNQDNPISWVDWDRADRDFLDFTARMVAFRKAHPILRQKLFLHARERAIDGLEDLFWWREDGEPMRTTDWIDPSRRLVAVEMRTASGTPPYATLESAIFLVLNAGKPASVTLPEPPEGQVWTLRVDTARPDLRPERLHRAAVEVAAESLAAVVLEPEVRPS
jgi:glycogen operon protein